MIYGVKLKKLQELAGNPQKYRSNLRGLLGISENESTNEPTIDHKARSIRPQDFSFAEVAHTFLGRDYVAKLAEVSQMNAMGRLMEAGGTVLPSHFGNISAFNDTVAGLIDAMVIEAYQGPEFIGDQVFDVVSARVNGGAMIGVMNDSNGQETTDLLDGQPYGSVGLKETRVEIPDNQRHGISIELNQKVFLYDRTDQVQSACQNAGYSVARNREVRMADTFLGITNTYTRDGVSSNTYLTTAGTTPNDYVNMETNPLVDWHDIDQAIQLLEGNTDPGTGFEISIPREGMQLVVAPQKQMATAVIVRASSIQVNTNSAVDRTLADNPLPALTILSSRIWYNRLIAASVNASNAKNRWHLGQFKKAFGYRQVVPFQVNQAQIGLQEQKRDIVLAYVAMEHGVSFTKEPRYAYKGTEE